MHTMSHVSTFRLLGRKDSTLREMSRFCHQQPCMGQSCSTSMQLLPLKTDHLLLLLLSHKAEQPCCCCQTACC